MTLVPGIIGLAVQAEDCNGDDHDRHGLLRLPRQYDHTASKKLTTLTQKEAPVSMAVWILLTHGKYRHAGVVEVHMLSTCSRL